ncbi:MAG TPA: hypothetical protein VKB46_15300 [Pyrinomonadaceae bacterium]|nr:hypothetical protein [Pyrinomonadaceae bacterium]
MRPTLLLFVFAAMLSGAMAQRPRSAEPTSTPKPAPAPQTVKAKYEGGVFGYRNTMEGTLTFDDQNNQLLFKDQKTTKQIHIPYDAITQAFADTQKRQPKAASIAQHVPLIYAPNPAAFIKTKVRYLTLQYNDPDSKVSGVTSFKLENKEMLNSVLATLAEKTGMTMRGDIYVKKRDADPTNP